MAQEDDRKHQRGRSSNGPEPKPASLPRIGGGPRGGVARQTGGDRVAGHGGGGLGRAFERFRGGDGRGAVGTAAGAVSTADRRATSNSFWSRAARNSMPVA